LLNRFYEVATAVLLDHDAVIDKMIGDELMAFFPPGLCGRSYRRSAVEAGVEILRAVGYGSVDGPWLELGVGVNAGQAYVGNVGPAGMTDFTALGHAVNVASRLQEHAAAGELVVEESVCEDLVSLVPAARREAIDIRGRDEPLQVFIAGAA
jgi:adenylate cyclase